MSNIKYKNLLKEISIKKLELSSLPQGYISKKKIKGHEYFYLQIKINNKIKSKYIPESEVANLRTQIEESKKLKLELPNLKLRLTELEKAAKLLDKKIYRELLLLKYTKGIDDLDISKKSESMSFANAMNAIEGIGISQETEAKLEKWKNGNDDFLSIFHSTLIKYGFPVEVVNA